MVKVVNMERVRIAEERRSVCVRREGGKEVFFGAVGSR